MGDTIKMVTLQTLILSIVQGITEFLPISSSAHLIVLSKLPNWIDQSLGSNVAYHAGTLLAVLLYFWRDFVELCIGGIEIVLLRHNQRTQYTAKIILATLPIVFVGFYFKDNIKQLVLFDDTIMLIGFTSIIFGLLLWLIDKITPDEGYITELSYMGALLLGFLQILALIPGVSRSGICMTAARMFGLKRTESAKISLIMGMPVLLGAVVLMGLDWYKITQQQQTTFFDIDFDINAIYGMVISFVVASMVIHFMMVWFRHFSMSVFAIYRILLGIVLLVVFL